MSVDAKVIERIKKLLALAGNNPNEHEAASAAARAQDLMQEYDLTAEAVSTKMDPRTAGIGRSDHILLRKRGKATGWKVTLYQAVGDTSGCWVYNSGRGGDDNGWLIGRHIDVEMAHYVYDFLVRELERLQKAHGDARWVELREYAKRFGISTHDAERDFSSEGRHPLRAKDSWIRGAVGSVVSGLYEAKRQRDASEAANALVIHKEAALKDWWAQQNGYADWAAWSAANVSKRDSDQVRIEPSKAEQRRMEAAWRRADKKARTERERLNARTDWAAFEAGVSDGRKIRVVAGVRGGDVPAEPVLIDG